MTTTELLDAIASEPDNHILVHELIEQMPGDTDDDRLIEAAKLVYPLSEENLTKAMHENEGSVAKTFQDLGDRHFICDQTNDLYYQCHVCDKIIGHGQFKRHMSKH